MEEEIQIILDNIWETNTDSEELLLQKHSNISFSPLLNKDQIRNNKKFYNYFYFSFSMFPPN